MGSEAWHEPYESLTPYTREMHRAIVSLMEELEAIDWYQQRVDVTADEELKAVLAHNRDEEIEHAMMNLEWIRRNSATFDAAARAFLFSEGSITEIEEKVVQETGGAGTGGAAMHEPPGDFSASPSDGSLGIGSLKLV